MAGAGHQNPRLDAISRYISATWLGILLLAVAIIIAVRLLSMAFPGVLDGRDIIAAGLHPNYLRNIFELISLKRAISASPAASDADQAEGPSQSR